MKKASSSLALPDVNVLLALAWPNHQFHHAAVKRMQRGRERWATCAITGLGFLRLSCNAAVVQSPRTPAEAASLLNAMVSDPMHVYLDELPSPVSGEFMMVWDRMMGFRQMTDGYLLMLAGKHQATLLTFDTRLAALAGPAKSEILGI